MESEKTPTIVPVTYFILKPILAGTKCSCCHKRLYVHVDTSTPPKDQPYSKCFIFCHNKKCPLKPPNL